MSAQERDKLLLSDTLVPDLFITQYMSSLSGAAIQLYLLLLMDRSNSASLTIDSLARKIGWTKDEVKEQVFHLTSAGIMERDGDKISLSDIKAKEVDRYIEWKENADLITPPQHVDPSMESLSRSIDDTFFMGHMNYSWHRFIDESASVFKLKPDVIYALFGALSERNKLLVKSTKPAEELREKWCQRGVHTSEELEKIQEEDRNIKECTDAMGKKLRKKLDGVAIEYIEKWMLVYKMEPKVPPFLYTYLRKEKRKEQVTFPQMDEILQEWFSHNIHTEEEASLYENKKVAADRMTAMTNFCGELFRKKLDGMDLEIISKWANEDLWEEPMVRYAYEVLHQYMNTITISQVDDRLKLWKENGVASVTRAKQFEAESRKKNKEEYQARKKGPIAGQLEIPFLENEYSKAHLDQKEQESIENLDRLLGEE